MSDISRTSLPAVRFGGIVMMAGPGEDDAHFRDRLEAARREVEAVRRASVRVLDRSRRAAGHGHPFYRAAFVAAGNWR